MSIEAATKKSHLSLRQVAVALALGLTAYLTAHGVANANPPAPAAISETATVPNRIIEATPIISPDGTNLLQGPLNTSAIGWSQDEGTLAHIRFNGTKFSLEMARLDGKHPVEYTSTFFLPPRWHDSGNARIFVNTNPAKALGGCAQSAEPNSPLCTGVQIESAVELMHGLGDSAIYFFRDDKHIFSLDLGNTTAVALESIGVDKMIMQTTDTDQLPPTHLLSTNSTPDTLTLVQPSLNLAIPVDLSAFRAPDGTRIDPYAQLTITRLNHPSNPDGQIVVFDKTTRYLYYANVDNQGHATVTRAVNSRTDSGLQLKNLGPNLGGLYFDGSSFRLLGIIWNGQNNNSGTNYEPVPSIATDFTTAQNPSLIGIQPSSDGSMTYYVKTQTDNFQTKIFSVTRKPNGTVEKIKIAQLSQHHLPSNQEQVYVDKDGNPQLVVGEGWGDNERYGIFSEPKAVIHIPIILSQKGPAVTSPQHNFRLSLSQQNLNKTRSNKTSASTF